MWMNKKLIDIDTGDLYAMDTSFPPYCPICHNHQLHYNKYENCFECRKLGKTFRAIDTINLRKQLLLIKRLIRINSPKSTILKQINLLLKEL